MFIVLLIYSAVAEIFLVPYLGDYEDLSMSEHEFNHTGTNHAIESILDALDRYPSLKLVWTNTDDLLKAAKIPVNITARLREFVLSQRVEIVSNAIGDSQTLLDLESTVRIMENSLEIIRNVFGVKQYTVAWHSSPYGYTSMVPALLEKLGFKYAVINQNIGANTVKNI